VNTRRTPLISLLVLGLLGCLLAPSVVLADQNCDASVVDVEKYDVLADRMKTKVPRSQPYFDEAYAVAFWPVIVRVGAGFGGAYGKGTVFEQGEPIGTTGYWQFTSGIQAGAKGFAMAIFFRDEAALTAFQERPLEFMGQAGLDIATVGWHGTPAYNDGVAVIAMTRFGLMAEFAISGVKFTYKPLPGCE